MSLTFRIQVLALTLSCATLFAQPQATIAPSPHPALSVSPIAPGDPATDALFAGGTANLRPVSLLLKNVGTQPILSVVLLVTSAQVGGRPITQRDVADAFAQNGHPVLNAGDSLVAIPAGGFYHPRDLAVSGPAVSLLQNASNQIARMSSQVTVSVDAILFASGEVDGPDTTNFMGELLARKQAAQSIMAAINGPSPQADLSKMAAQKFQKGNWLGYWQHFWADICLKASQIGGATFCVPSVQASFAIPALFRGANPGSSSSQGGNQ